MAGKTSLQDAIIDYASENPDKSGTAIAETVGCSPSYASEIRNRYLDAIIGEIDLSERNITISFSDPYSIYISDELNNELDTENHNLLNIQIESTEKHIDNHITVSKQIDEFDFEKEMHSWLYGIYSAIGSLPESFNSKIERYIDESGNSLSIYSPSSCSEFLGQVSSIIRDRHSHSDIIIGAGLLEREMQSKDRDLTPLFLPNFPTSHETFTRVLREYHLPRVIDIEPYRGEIQNIDESYFLLQYANPEKSTQKVKEDILSYRYFHLKHSYRFGNQGAIRGPVAPGPQDIVIDICETDISFIDEIIRPASSSKGSITFEDLVEITTDLHISLGDNNSEPLERYVYRDPDYIMFPFIGNISLSVVNNHIVWVYPDSIGPLSQFVERLTAIIDDHYEYGLSLHDPQTISTEHETFAEEWVFDTNSVYHETVDNNPSNILRSFLPNRIFYDSTITIPWIVLYEINKHKDRGGPSPSIQEQGLENIRTLKVLDEYGFISLDVQPVSESTKEITESDIADMEILRYIQSKENAALVSDDGRLRDICGISNTDAINILDYADINDSPDLSEAVREAILSKIGHQLRTKENICSTISEEIDKQIQQSAGRYKTEVAENPEIYINQWMNDEELISYPSQSEECLYYNRATPEKVVITPTATSKLADDIIDFEGDKYLSEETLEHLADILNLSSPGLPLLQFQVPISNVIAPQSVSLSGISVEARQMSALSYLKNAKYETKELSDPIGREEHIHDAVLLARELGCPLLCAETDNFLTRIAHLLGIRVLEYDL